MVADYLSMPQLSLLLQSIVLGTVAVFIAFMNGLGTDSAGIKPACLSIFVWLMTRLFCKTCMAERVTTEVSGSVVVDTYMLNLLCLL